jgi:lipoprotein-releasing system ATP-binding protein
MILHATNIRKTYSQAARPLDVLKGVDLTVAKGDVLAIIGPSGAGKSTLLHILGGLDRPTQGQVLFEGQDVYGLDDRQRAKLRNEKIGFVFQFYHLLPEFTALENVLMPALVKGAAQRDSGTQQRASDLLNRVGLKERVSHRPSQLSGGEQQRVAIARSLMNSPEVIFCDEPTGNLDSQTGQDIVRLLLELNRDNQQTLVIVTHDPHIAGSSHKTIHMRDGLLTDS